MHRTHWSQFLGVALLAALSGCGGGGAVAPADAGPHQTAEGYGAVRVTVYVPPALTATLAERREIPSTTNSVRITVSRQGIDQVRTLAMSDIVNGRGTASFTVQAGTGYAVAVEARNQRDAVVASAQQNELTVPEAASIAVQLRLRTPSTPSVRMSASPVLVDVGQAVTLEAWVEGAVEAVREYQWDLGDGRTTVGAPPITTAYTTEGQRIITCRVLDGAGQTASASTTITVRGLVPILQVEPVELSLGTTESSGQFIVSNVGTGSLPWLASVDTSAPWIRLTGATGGTDGGTVPVEVDRASLAPRPEPYRGTVRFLQTGGQGQQVDAVVLVYVPRLEVTTTELDFGAAADALSLTVINAGSGDLGSWSAQSSAAWLSAEPASGLQDATVTVRANRVGLTPGTHQATLSFTSAFGSVTVTATCQVAAATLQVSPGTLDFGVSQTQQTIAVTASSGSLNWTASSNQGWLTVTSAGSTPATAVVSVNRAALPGGTSRGTLTFTAGSSTASVEVSATANATTGDIGLVVN